MLRHLSCFLSYLDILVSKSNPTCTVPSRKPDVRPLCCRQRHALLLPHSVLEPGVPNMLFQKLNGMDIEPAFPTEQIVVQGLCHGDHQRHSELIFPHGNPNGAWWILLLLFLPCEREWQGCLRIRTEIALASCSPPTLEKQHVIKLEVAALRLLDECRTWVCQTTQTHLATVCALGMCRASLSTPCCLSLPEHACQVLFSLKNHSACVFCSVLPTSRWTPHLLAHSALKVTWASDVHSDSWYILCSVSCVTLLSCESIFSGDSAGAKSPGRRGERVFCLKWANRSAGTST